MQFGVASICMFEISYFGCDRRALYMLLPIILPISMPLPVFVYDAKLPLILFW